MLKFTHNPVLKLTVMIALAIVTVSCIVVMAGTHLIAREAQHGTGRQAEKLAHERYTHYKNREGIRTGSMRWINERNQCSIVQIVRKDDTKDVTLEVYINGEEVDLQQPISSIKPKLNQIFERDVEEPLLVFCQSQQIDIKEDAIGELDAEIFMDLISALEEETRLKR